MKTAILIPDNIEKIVTEFTNSFEDLDKYEDAQQIISKLRKAINDELIKK